MEALTRGVLIALAVLNIGLTVWHWFILRRARRSRAETARHHDEAERILEAARALIPHESKALYSPNGHRPHEEGPEP